MTDLYSCGQRLAASSLGELRLSNDLLGQAAAQRERMATDGYLLFRGLLNRVDVLEARREILLKYAIAGEVESVSAPVELAVPGRASAIAHVNISALSESVMSGLAYQRVISSQPLLDFYSGFLGGEVRPFEFAWPRFVRPGEGTPVHADIVYIGRGTRNVWSSWIPLGDVPRPLGALMVLENSHNRPALEPYWSLDADRDGVGWFSRDPEATSQDLTGRWLTTDFMAGDVICFDPKLLHASLDNMTETCRLSSDSRYQLASEPLDDRWNGGNANPHGGPLKAFLPGLLKGGDNKEFQDEWKLVDPHGRMASAVSTA
jgi:hypothetical protein